MVATVTATGLNLKSQFDQKKSASKISTLNIRSSDLRLLWELVN